MLPPFAVAIADPVGRVLSTFTLNPPCMTEFVATSVAVIV